MDKKKRVAAVSAVAAYIKSQEEAAAYAAAADMEQAPVQEPMQQPARALQSFSAWGISGRQAQMDGRFLLQMRAFK